MVSTAVTTRMAPRIHNRYGLVLMPGTDTNDTGFPVFAIYKFDKGLSGPERGRQQLGLIGDYAIDSIFRQPDHRGLIIYGPGKYFLPGNMQVRNQFSSNQALVHDYELHRQLPPSTQLFAGLADNSQRDCLASRSKIEQHSGKKRGDYIAMLEREPRKRSEYKRFDPRHFQFDIEECAAGVASKNIFENWQSLELFASGPGNRDSRKPASMADHGAAVSSEAHVEFEPITAMREGQIECGKGVLPNSR